MNLMAKLNFLMECSNRSAVARKAGISPTKLWNYMNAGQMPNSATAVRLARALGVDCGWLIDDSRGLPVVHVEQHDEISATKVAA